MYRSRAASSTILLLALALAAATGCCYCGTPLYDIRAHETWNELERGLHGGATSVDGEQTGVSIQLPVLFDSKETKTFRPGGEASIDILPERIQPPGLPLPGLRFTCETLYTDTQDRELPVSCYLAVLAKGSAERTKAKDQLLAAAKPSYPSAQWEAATLPGSTLAAEKLSLVGPQKFVPAEATRADAIIETAGQLDLYLVAGEHANVLVGFRAPVDIAQRVSLFEAAAASVASIKSEKPAAPIATTPGEQPGTQNYVAVPNSNIELVPPAGFIPSTTMSGFEKPGGASITVIPQPHPYANMVKSYTPDTLKGYNIAVLQQEDVTIGGAPALLLLLERTNPKQTYWNLVFGDDSGSFVVTGTLADAGDEAEKQALRTALLTARKKP